MEFLAIRFNSFSTQITLKKQFNSNFDFLCELIRVRALVLADWMAEKDQD
jgi:hypothetical protein